MNAHGKLIAFEGVKITLSRRSYGDKLQSVAMTERFALRRGDESTYQELQRIGRSNFAFCISFLEAVEGASLTVPHPDMTDAEFDAAYQQFAALDEWIIDRWLAAANALSNPVSAPESAPLAALTPEQAKSPE